MTTDPAFFTAREAAEHLGVKRETLYAYVSRGLVHSKPAPAPRERLYLRRDIEDLRLRRARRNPPAITREVLSGGMPVLDSSITLIDDGRLYYRGRDVAELVERCGLEEVAALLWLGDEERWRELFPARPEPLSAGWRRLASGLKRSHPGDSLALVLRWAAAADTAGLVLEREPVARCGARLLTALLDWVAGLPSAGGTLTSALSRRWLGKAGAAAGVVDSALILCADHELNVSSFTARCVASAGSSPYEAVSAGLSALRGFRHGGHSDLVEALLAELGVGPESRPPARAEVRRRLGHRLRRGERLPGFGQMLYPQGDPRWPLLFARLERAFPGSPAIDGVRIVAEEGERLVSRRPTIDFALAAMSAQLGLGRGGAFTLFALGRTVGWVAHAIEEYARATLIRPRARYTGTLPGAAPDAR